MARITKKIHAKLGPLFYKIAENSSHVYWLRSGDFQQQLYVSPAFEKLWPVSSAELYANPALWLSAIVEGDRDRIRQQFMEWQAKSSSDQVTKINYRIRNRFDEIVCIEDTAVPIFDGRVCLAFVGVATDVTGRRGNSEGDDRSNQLFRCFIEKSDSVFWVTDATGERQIYVNAAYEKIWQRTVSSRIENSKTWIDAVVPEDRNKCGYPNISLSGTESGSSSIYRITTPTDEVRWIKGKCFAVRSENGSLLGYAGIENDVTVDVIHENELRDAKEYAERANEAKSDFLAMMSHELRTPLNAILGMAQILRQSTLSLTQEDQIDVITQAGGNLLSLLNDILDFTKLEVGKLEFTEAQIKLHALLASLERDMRQQANSKGLQLSCSVAEDVSSVVLGDERRLLQVLTNLVSNAIKYTRQGKVSIRVTRLQKNNKQTVLCFTVEDTGIGIEKDMIDRIFNRFQQIDSIYQRNQQGVGLGLAIVKELVDRMGGSTTVSSEVGIGSQFSCIIPFDLPRAETEHSAAHDDGKSALENVFFDANILVVEDNKINQKISKLMLEKIGCRVDIAENATQALNQRLNHYDLIFMDLGLPDMDGFETTLKIRELENPGQHIPIIAMTAHVFARDQERCYKVGMDAVVAKPILQEDLIAVLQRWVRKAIAV